MTAGNQPTKGFTDQRAGALTTGLRDLMAQVQDFNDELSAQGGAAGLEAIGYTAQDAAGLIAAFGNLAGGLNAVYNGQASSVALPFDFRGNSRALWGIGQ